MPIVFVFLNIFYDVSNNKTTVMKIIADDISLYILAMKIWVCDGV